MLNVSNGNNSKALFCKKLTHIQLEQPWFVLSAENHYDFIISEDHAISHFYTFEADLSDSATFAIPDGAIDILFDCDQTNPSAKICGSTLQASSAHLKHKHRYFGVRFAAGVLPGFLTLAAAELVNQELNLLELSPENESLFFRIANNTKFLSQVSLFKQILNIKPHRKPSIITRNLIREIYETQGNLRIKNLEEHAGYTSRTLQRQFQNDMGMSPKAFSRIVRCQMAIHKISRLEELAFSELASNLGFSDQSHFQREFKKLVSTTPLNYQRRIKQRPYLERIRQNFLLDIFE